MAVSNMLLDPSSNSIYVLGDKTQVSSTTSIKYTEFNLLTYELSKTNTISFPQSISGWFEVLSSEIIFGVIQNNDQEYYPSENGICPVDSNTLTFSTIK